MRTDRTFPVIDTFSSLIQKEKYVEVSRENKGSLIE